MKFLLIGPGRGTQKVEGSHREVKAEYKQRQP